MFNSIKNTPLNFIVLGISAAMPSFALGLPFGLWLLSAGVSKQTLGLVTVSSIVVALNFMWSPFINKIKLPFLYSRLGLRRSWLILAQVCLGLLLLIYTQINPQNQLSIVVIVACMIYFFSSIQDIALDAYRVEYDEYHDAEVLATNYQIGYKIGAFLIGAQVYSIIGVDNWSAIFFYLAVLMFLMPLVTIFSKRVKELENNQNSYSQFLSAFKELVTKRNILVLLLLVGVYKISDIVLGPMAASLYAETGLNKPDYLEMKSYFNFLATFVGSGLALVFIKKYQINKAMLFGALLVLSTNILFSYLYLYPTYTNFIGINFLDTIAQAFTAVCFITYLVGLVDRRFTAIQYSFLASLVIIPGTLLRGSSGFLVESLSFYNFFILMGFIGIPAVCLSYLLEKDLALSKENIFKITSIAMAISIFLLSISNISSENIISLNDKLIHFIVYFVLAVTTFYASKNTNQIILIFIIISIGIVTEFAQSITGLRNFEYMDIIANSFGVLGGYIIFSFIKKTLKKAL
jgi:PAT family beta-lactamase induction signal transducer AmpG